MTFPALLMWRCAAGKRDTMNVYVRVWTKLEVLPPGTELISQAAAPAVVRGAALLWYKRAQWWTNAVTMWTTDLNDEEIVEKRTKKYFKKI